MAPAEALPRTIRLLTAVLLVLTFAAGTVTGVGLARWIDTRPGPPPPPFLSRRVLRELELSAEQEQKARALMERRRPELEAVLRETFPKVRAINESMEQEFRNVLTPEQSAKFDRAKAQRPPGPPLGFPPGPPPPPGAFPDRGGPLGPGPELDPEEHLGLGGPGPMPGFGFGAPPPPPHGAPVASGAVRGPAAPPATSTH